MPRPPAPCGTPSAYKRHKRKGEPVDEACRVAILADSRARSGRADDEAQSAPVVALRGAFTASTSLNPDARERLLANLRLVERAMEALAEADPLKIVQLSKRHSEIVGELVAIDGGHGHGQTGGEGAGDPFAFLGNAARGPAPAPRKQA